MADHSNPLLSDPSIISVSYNDGTTKPEAKLNVKTDLDSLEPSNALSQLLDSAMSNAAKESSPEFESKPSPSSASTTDSPKSNKFNKYDFTATKSTSDKIYTIEELLALKNTALTSIADQMPPQEFWVLRKTKKEMRQTNPPHKKHGGRREFEQKREKKRDNEYNERDPEETPELSDKLKLEMGDTVEDFERWKQAQRIKQGGSAPPPAAGGGFFELDSSPAAAGEQLQPEPSNDVDNFFSYVNPKAGEEKKAQDASRSSRFSSFFTPPVEKPEEKPVEGASRFFGGPSSPAGPTPGQVPQQQQAVQPGPNGSNSNRSNGGTPRFPEQPMNRRSFSGPGQHIQGQQMQGPPQGQPMQGPPQGHMPPNGQRPQGQFPPGQRPGQMQGPPGQMAPGQLPPHLQQLPPGVPMGFPPGLSQPPPGFPAANDSFFMSLLQRAPEENGSPQKQVPNQLPPWFNKLQGQPGPGQPGNPGQRGQPGQMGPPPGMQGHPGSQPGQGPAGQGPPGQHMRFPPGMQPPSGMFPPGMLPPGYPQYDPNMMRNMPPPGQQGQPNQGPQAPGPQAPGQGPQAPGQGPQTQGPGQQGQLSQFPPGMIPRAQNGQR